MKKLLEIMVLSLLLITPSQANDIRDFQIEGITLGDSLLDYFSEEEIKNNIVKNIYKNKFLPVLYEHVYFLLVNSSSFYAESIVRHGFFDGGEHFFRIVC